MRKIVYSMMVSADGFVDGPDPEQNWHNWNEEMSAYMMDVFKTLDLFIYGRKSYEGMIEYWPPLTDEFARIMNEMPKLVHSKTLKKASWNAELKSEINPTEIRKLKEQPGKDIIIFAGPSIASEYIKHNLVDEFRMIVNPVVLGSGKAYFNAVHQPFDLKLVSAKAFNCGNVLLTYTLRA